jgi:hypothetical protein
VGTRCAQRLHEKSETSLLALTETSEEEQAARERELETLSSEVEASQKMLLTVEHQKQQMEVELARLREAAEAGAATTANDSVGELKESITAKEQIISRLHQVRAASDRVR